MNKIFRTLMITLLVAGTACTSQAQDDKDKKVTIQITKEVDGETKTFKGEYRNEEEMRNDPSFKEFAGEDESLKFFFDGEGDMESIIQLHGGARAFSFGLDDDDFPHGMRKNFRFRQNGPQAFFFGDDDAVFDLKGWNSEEFEEELDEKMKELEAKLKDLDQNLQNEIMESLKEIEGLHSEMGFPKRIKRGGVSVSDVGDDFGKRGKVEAKNSLELEEINYMIMGKRLTLRFRIPEDGELSVKISNDAGKDIYNRYFESFAGTFSDNIDFSKYSEGKYLLEIELDKKRLTKKIVID